MKSGHLLVGGKARDGVPAVNLLFAICHLPFALSQDGEHA
jgi:hypothetical protein